MKHKPPILDEIGSSAMTLQRLQQLLDTYGASPERWPSDERAAGLALLEHSTEAQALRRETERFDSLLDLAPTLSPSAELTARILEAAPPKGVQAEKRRHNSLQLLQVKGDHRSHVVRRHVNAGRTRRRPVWVALAAVASLVVILWGVRVLTPTPRTLSSEVIANLGVYNTPTDVLLEWPGVENLDTLPSVGCREAELGCPNLDVLPKVESQSLAIGRRYV